MSDGYRAADRPVCRLARASYLEVGEEDARAGRVWHLHFERWVDGAHLMARRVKHRSRTRVGAGEPVAFGVRWAVLRRRKLGFALGLLPRWWWARGVRVAWLRRVMGRDLGGVTGASLRRLLARTWYCHLAVRRVHAALWYPVDLLEDLREFSDRVGWDGAAQGVAMPRLRREREFAELALLASVRAGHGGPHPRFDRLRPAEQRAVVRHLQRHPHAFASAHEVQDLSSWVAGAEEPGAWWDALDGVAVEPLAEPARPAWPGLVTWLAALPPRLLIRPFASAKDDRVEALALSQAAVRRVCLELARRAGEAGNWVFELDPHELDRLACDPERGELLRALGRQRLEERRGLEGAVRGKERLPVVGPLTGRPLAAGVATGRARVVATPQEARLRVGPGDVLVTDEVRPAFTLAVGRAAAFVFRHGSALCHGAIVARERGIPAVALGDALDGVEDGAMIVVDGRQGTVEVS